MKASPFLVRQESGKEAPGPSVTLKNTNSNANNWRICVFLTDVYKRQMFINFMCETEVALANAAYICYSSPQTEVLSLIHI